MKTDYFKMPYNKHMGKKPKDWEVPKYSKEKYGKPSNGRQENRKKEVIIFNDNRFVEDIPKS